MWNLYNYWDTEDFDTSGSFKFLADELVACEENGRYAWIIAHVPPGGDDDDAIPKPSAVFSKIIQRFSPHIITGIFSDIPTETSFKFCMPETCWTMRSIKAMMSKL